MPVLPETGRAAETHSPRLQNEGTFLLQEIPPLKTCSRLQPELLLQKKLPPMRAPRASGGLTNCTAAPPNIPVIHSISVRFDRSRAKLLPRLSKTLVLFALPSPQIGTLAEPRNHAFGKRLTAWVPSAQAFLKRMMTWPSGRSRMLSWASGGRAR